MKINLDSCAVEVPPCQWEKADVLRDEEHARHSWAGSNALALYGRIRPNLRSTSSILVSATHFTLISRSLPSAILLSGSRVPSLWITGPTKHLSSFRDSFRPPLPSSPSIHASCASRSLWRGQFSFCLVWTFFPGTHLESSPDSPLPPPRCRGRVSRVSSRADHHRRCTWAPRAVLSLHQLMRGALPSSTFSDTTTLPYGIHGTATGTISLTRAY
ncbi:hypothetical protein B0H19DRAFT_1254200 [Mycena capillaripes]|nr:hypothetical protein B0H19DRAFT_1254200 [Mycena capillaripes]